MYGGVGVHVVQIVVCGLLTIVYRLYCALKKVMGVQFFSLLGSGIVV